jgi:hypothetical protein
VPGGSPDAGTARHLTPSPALQRVRELESPSYDPPTLPVQMITQMRKDYAEKKMQAFASLGARADGAGSAVGSPSVDTTDAGSALSPRR